MMDFLATVVALYRAPVMIVPGLYLLIALGIAGSGVRQLARYRTSPTAPPSGPNPAQVAYLTGGPTGAITTSLGALRLLDAVGLDREQALTRTGPLPADASRLDEAVHEAAGRGLPPARVGRQPSVRSAVDALRAELVRVGWLRHPEAHSAAVARGEILHFVMIFGLIQTIGWGIVHPLAAVSFAIATAVAGVAGLALRRVKRLTRAGRRTLGAAVEEHSHLSSRYRPAWRTYGIGGLTLGLALFGSAPLWRVDPAFATAIAAPESHTVQEFAELGDACAAGCGGGGCGGCGGCGG